MCQSAPGRIRTADASLRTAALYPLSYGGATAIVPRAIRLAARREPASRRGRHGAMAAAPPCGGLFTSRGPRRLHHPVDFPGRPAIRREGLLPTGAGRGQVRPDEADKDRPTVEGIVGNERADAVLESSNN